MKKGESLLDTVQTIEAMGIDAIVVRHARGGAPHGSRPWTSASVVNAGDGCHEHPTQALLDAFTLRRHRGPSLDGCRVAIVGDVKHSRVARSNIKAFHTLGCELTLVGPPTLMPERLDGWPVACRLRPRRGAARHRRRLSPAHPARAHRRSALPDGSRVRGRWGLTVERAARCKPDTFVMHPGPMNRGVEIAGVVADSARSLVTEQVTNGVAVRMAVLWTLLGSGGPFV